MRFISFEHGRFFYQADMVFYALVVAATFLWLTLSRDFLPWPQLMVCVGAGWVAWTFMEYVMHRFVLHGIRPFSFWHAQHHARPKALICTPTLLSASALAGLVFLPACVLLGSWAGGAWTLGVVTGYFIYTLTHHATHHWRSENSWLLRRKRWHAWHHHHAHPICFGVTSGFWDRIFGSAYRAGLREPLQ